MHLLNWRKDPFKPALCCNRHAKEEWTVGTAYLREPVFDLCYRSNKQGKGQVQRVSLWDLSHSRRSGAGSPARTWVTDAIWGSQNTVTVLVTTKCGARVPAPPL